jgi:hypothetical protein
MLYRGWTITTQRTFLGFSAQYVSPMGHPRRGGGSFATDDQAIAYAQTLVDQTLLCEWRGCREDSPAVLVG